VAVDREVAHAPNADTEPPQASVSPARSLPGDPEIRIPAPANARAVTVVLPFGESIAATYEPSLRMWSARFLVPRDAAEGSYPIEVLITKANGELEHQRLWYTVDESAALVHLEVDGQARPGAEVTLRATQVITDADLVQVGRRRDELSAQRLMLLSDARRVEARAPNGSIVNLAQSAPGLWEGNFRIPADARGTMRFDVVVVDMAANVSHQPLAIEVAR
jgi:hypothetical protein